MRKLIFTVTGLLLNFNVSGALPVGSEYQFHGNLVAEPCTLLPDDESVVLNFGTIVDKYLYTNQRTNSQPFELHLIDCDTSLGKSVTMRFTGTESLALPGLLAVNGASQASGIAVGMEASDGRLLPLNQVSYQYPLQDGSNTLTMKAYVQGEPDAIAKKTIGHGTFSAVATFELIYE